MNNPVEVPVQRISLIGVNEDQLKKVSETMQLGLTVDEMLKLREYFKGLNRNPTDIELHAIAQAWSEHCCYKSSKFYLKKYFSSLEKHDAILAMEDDAGVVSFDEEYAYVVKMESHNHPSAIEPYGGAATGVGGIIRDVLCMGAQPVALLDSLYLGEVEKTVWNDNALHPRFIFTNVVAGIRDYGNRVGIPNIAGSVDFDPSFNHSPLVNAGCVGIAKKSKIVRSFVSKVGDVLVLAGGRTGRDGIHGVNFASAELTEKSETLRSAVQLGNPIIKEPLIHAILEANDLNLIDGMKDLGGGGLSSSLGEMCFSGGTSAVVDLEKVLLKDSNMKPWEIWVSESQERMLLAVSPENLKAIGDIFEKWDIEYSSIGTVTAGRDLIIRFKGEEIFNLELSFVTGGPMYCRPYELPAQNPSEYILVKDDFNLKEFLLDFLHDKENCSRFNITRQYDHTVRGETFIRPQCGIPNFETHSDATLIHPVPESPKGLAITSGSRKEMVEIDPLNGTTATMIEAYLNILVTGAVPNSVVDCVNLGNPESKEIMGQMVSIFSAISDFCKKMELPVVAGNISLYNQFDGKNIKPVPSIMMAGIIDDASRAITVNFKEEGNLIYVIGSESSNLGGSHFLKYLGKQGRAIPSFDVEELSRIAKAYLSAAKSGFILSAHDVSSGGLIQTLMEMSFGSNIGFDVDLSNLSGARYIEKLFSEGGQRIVVEVGTSDKRGFEDLMRGVAFRQIGRTIKERISISDQEMLLLDGKVDEFRERWVTGLDGII